MENVPNYLRPTASSASRSAKKEKRRGGRVAWTKGEGADTMSSPTSCFLKPRDLNAKHGGKWQKPHSKHSRLSMAGGHFDIGGSGANVGFAPAASTLGTESASGVAFGPKKTKKAGREGDAGRGEWVKKGTASEDPDMLKGGEDTRELSAMPDFGEAASAKHGGKWQKPHSKHSRLSMAGGHLDIGGSGANVGFAPAASTLGTESASGVAFGPKKTKKAGREGDAGRGEWVKKGTASEDPDMLKGGEDTRELSAMPDFGEAASAKHGGKWKKPHAKHSRLSMAGGHFDIGGSGANVGFAPAASTLGTESASGVAFGPKKTKKAGREGDAGRGEWVKKGTASEDPDMRNAGGRADFYLPPSDFDTFDDDIATGLGSRQQKKNREHVPKHGRFSDVHSFYKKPE